MSLNITINMETGGTNRTIYVVFPMLIFGILMSLFMIRLIILFGRSSTFSNSFYRVLQLDLSVNLLYYWNTWLSYRFETNIIFLPIPKAAENIFSGILSLTKYLDFWFLHMQVLSALSMSLHRYVALCHPRVFDKLTKKMWRFWYVLYGFIIGVVSWALTPTMSESAYNIYIVDGSLMATLYLERYPKHMMLMAMFTGVYFFLLPFVGFIVAFLASRKISELSMSDRGIGKKLSKVTAWYLFVYPATLVWSLLSALDSTYHFLPSYTADVRAVSLGLSMDLMTFSLPFILMIHDTNVKQAIIRKPANVIRVRSIS